MNLQLQQSLVGKFARRQPFRGATRAPLRIVRAEDPISPDEGPVSGEIISCEYGMIASSIMYSMPWKVPIPCSPSFKSKAILMFCRCTNFARSH